MKRTITMVIAVLMMSGLSYAQGVEPAVKAGAKSLNFTFGGFGNFGFGAAGVAGGISGSYFMNQQAALRVGLQIYSNSTSTPWNDFSGNGSNPGSDGTTSTFALGIGADYLSYMSALTPRVKPYIGAGVAFTMVSDDSKPAISNAAGTGTLIETKNGNGSDGITFGVVGIAGAEFFLYPEISLSAEYQLNIFSLTSRSNMVQSFKNTTSVTTKEGSATSILGFGSVGAGVHIYF